MLCITASTKSFSILCFKWKTFQFFESNTVGINSERPWGRILHLRSLCKEGQPQLSSQILIPAISASLCHILCPPRNILKRSSWISYPKPLSSTSYNKHYSCLSVDEGTEPEQVPRAKEQVLKWLKQASQSEKSNSKVCVLSATSDGLSIYETYFIPRPIVPQYATH